MLKIGDIVYCKTDCIKTEDITFYKDVGYKVIDIFNDMIGVEFHDVITVMDIHDRTHISFYDFIFYHNFYTKKEYRKLKLKKILDV